MNEEEPQFKVIDRRRNAGNPEDSSSNASSDEPVKAVEKKEPAAMEQSADSPLMSEQAQAAGAPPQVDFTSFVMSLCTQAVIMLGEVPNPETGIVSVNMEAAKQTIDILQLLREKTQGNLTEDEDKLMSELVSSLQIAYVNKVQG